VTLADIEHGGQPLLGRVKIFDRYDCPNQVMSVGTRAPLWQAGPSPLDQS
jgi:hypothetical protein